MIRNRALPLFAAVWVGLLGAAPSARGDDPPPLPPLKLTIYPSAAAWPSLKYQLLPEFNTRIRGNAAVYYGKVTAESFGFFGNRELLDKIDDWREAPLEALQNDEAAITWSGVLTKLATAARCESCDWQLPVHEEDYYQILLPEVQQTRQFARILATTARIHIARGEFDDALRTLQSGFALVRNVAEGETIINGLVSIAINGMLYEQLTTFVQQPDAPNLYWALTMLPRPIVSLRKGVEAEIYAFGSSFPEVRDLNAKRTPDEWGQVLLRFWQGVLDLSDDKELREKKSAEQLVSANLKEYATAKRTLVERGMPTEFVDAMPAAQVVLTNTLRAFEELRDEAFRWFFVPYVEGVEGIEAMSAELDAKDVAGDDINSAQRLAKIFLPFVRGVRIAEVRSQRDIAVLRIIEALRIYGAGHDGRLPETLADMTEVPLPIDPMTGKPFGFRREGEVALIESLPVISRPAVYEIKMERK